jgi:hypothetical protein
MAMAVMFLLDGDDAGRAGRREILTGASALTSWPQSRSTRSVMCWRQPVDPLVQATRSESHFVGDLTQLMPERTGLGSPEDHRLERLTREERRALNLVGERRANCQIATELCLAGPAVT